MLPLTLQQSRSEVFGELHFADVPALGFLGAGAQWGVSRAVPGKLAVTVATGPRFSAKHESLKARHQAATMMSKTSRCCEGEGGLQTQMRFTLHRGPGARAVDGR